MPKISTHKKDEVYSSIMGDKEPSKTNYENDDEQISEDNTETNQITESTSLSTEQSVTEPIKNDLDEYVHKSFYITKRQVKAIKIRAATSDKPEEKDYSAIIRAALDAYLVDTLNAI